MPTAWNVACAGIDGVTTPQGADPLSFPPSHSPKRPQCQREDFLTELTRADVRRICGKSDENASYYSLWRNGSRRRSAGLESPSSSRSANSFGGGSSMRVSSSSGSLLPNRMTSSELRFRVRMIKELCNKIARMAGSAVASAKMNRR